MKESVLWQLLQRDVAKNFSADVELVRRVPVALAETWEIADQDLVRNMMRNDKEELRK